MPQQVDTSFLTPMSRNIVANLPSAMKVKEFSLEDMRAASNINIESNIPLPPVDTQEVEIPVHGGTLVQVNIYRPKNTAPNAVLPAIVFFHGGGFCIRHESGHAYLVSKLAIGIDCAVLFVRYSLSPEAKFPIALRECYSVVEYVSTARTAAKLRIDPKRIAVCGDSAGGNLAATVPLYAKQQNQPLENPIKYQILLYPCTDDDHETKSYKKYGRGYYLDMQMMDFFYNSYRKDEQRDNILLNPNKAATVQLMGLPPALLITAEADVLCDEGEAYGRKLLSAGVQVTAMRVNGVLHGFLSSSMFWSEESTQIVDMICATIRRAFYNNQ